MRRLHFSRFTFFFTAAVFLTAALVSGARPGALRNIPGSGSIRDIRSGGPQRSIKVMSYNIHRGIGKNGRLELDYIAETIRKADPDIIGLQEVERYSIRAGFQDQIKLLADKLSMNYAFGRSIGILGGQYGNAVLSRFPIESARVRELPSTGERRTVLEAVLNVDGRRLTVLDTHLGLKSDERGRQTAELLNMTAGKERMILLGDFNSKADKLRNIADKLADSGAKLHQGQNPTFKAGELEERIDYIFLSEEIEVTDYAVIESDASDHYPVVCTVK